MPLVDKDWKPCDPINSLKSSQSKPNKQLQKCTEGWTQLNVTGDCYAVTDLFATWSELRAHCESLGSELVSIHSNEQNRSLT
ncbi:hypothetical protein AAVH_38018, partial [Aphelenchoides avenae]